MSSFDPLEGLVGDARAPLRGHVARCGTVSATREVARPTGRHFEADLATDAGALTLVFLGRRSIPGIAPGAVLSVGGTLAGRHGRREIWNPRYRIER